MLRRFRVVRRLVCVLVLLVSLVGGVVQARVGDEAGVSYSREVGDHPSLPADLAPGGATVGVGYTQATAGTDSFSWGGLALTMGVGAVAGGLGGLAGAEVGSLVGSTAGSMIGSTAGDLLGNVAGGMAAGATTCGVSALLMGQSLSKDELGQCVLVGGAAAGILHVAGEAIPMVKPSSVVKPGETVDAVSTAGAGTGGDPGIAGKPAAPASMSAQSEGADMSVPQYIYKQGSDSAVNMTPRPGIDDVRDPPGLSAWTTAEAAAPNGGKVQIIDTMKLQICTARCDPTPAGHVSIIPGDGSTVGEWATTRGGAVVSPYTLDVQGAIVGSTRVSHG